MVGNGKLEVAMYLACFKYPEVEMDKIVRDFGGGDPAMTPKVGTMKDLTALGSAASLPEFLASGTPFPSRRDGSDNLHFIGALSRSAVFLGAFSCGW